MQTPRLIEGIRAVAFDLDGTLIDTAPDLASAVNKVLAIFSGVALPEDRIRGLIGNGVDQLVARALAESFGEDGSREPRRRQALALFRHLYAERLFVESRVYPGVREGLNALSRAGFALCCVTNKDRAFALPLLRAAGLSGFIATAFCGDRVEDRKPEPNLLLAVCAHFEVTPAELLYVGDSRTDVEAARAAGCRVALVNYGYSHGKSLESEEADALVSSLEAVHELGSRGGVA